jgi:hypothetical protein
MFAVLLLAAQVSAWPQIEAGYKTIYSSYLHRDAKRMEPVLAPNYVWRTQHGRTTSRQEVLRQQRTFISTILSCSKASAHVDKLTLHGPTAIVTVTDHVVAKVRDAKGSKTIESGSTTRDTWQRIGKRWLLTQTQELPRPRKR